MSVYISQHGMDVCPIHYGETTEVRTIALPSLLGSSSPPPLPSPPHLPPPPHCSLRVTADLSRGQNKCRGHFNNGASLSLSLSDTNGYTTSTTREKNLEETEKKSQIARTKCYGKSNPDFPG